MGVFVDPGGEVLHTISLAEPSGDISALLPDLEVLCQNEVQVPLFRSANVTLTWCKLLVSFVLALQTLGHLLR